MVLPPKPPPISAGMARMSESLAPVIRAVAFLTMKWPWLELQMVARPSAVTLTRHAWGSM